MELENTLLGGRYLLKKKLGEGGSGSVYLCHDSKLQKDWAVKEFKEPQDMERTMELELLKTISCNVFPRIVDIVKENAHIFLIMDYVEGITLKDKMKRQILTEADVLPWALEIAKGIFYLHQMTPPILYMDCKPDNIMLTKEGEIRLIDFGSAYVCRADRKQRISGTRFFAPKEQRERAPADDLPDVRTDIYAFGMTLYYLLTGGKKECRRNGKLSIKDVNPAVSWGMSHIIEKCTMENPKQRYQSMEEVIDKLRRIREIDRWKTTKVQAFGLFGLLGKIACAALVLVCAYTYRLNGSASCLFLCVLPGLLLLFLSMRKKTTVYEINRDIFCGSGKRVLYFALLVIGFISILHMTSYAAKDSNEDNRIAELEVIIYDSQGRKILIQDGASWEIEEDIMLMIPIEEISESDGKIVISYVSEKSNDIKQYSFKCHKK